MIRTRCVARERQQLPEHSPAPRTVARSADVVFRSAGCSCGGGCPSCGASRGGSGERLDAGVRADFEAQLGADLSGVRVHRDAEAGASASAVHARAYTVGSDVVFGAGEYAPHTTEGRHLLAHELTHVVQQASGPVAVQRQQQSEEAGELRATRYRNVTMHFDGRDLIVKGDGTEVFRFSGQSGRPLLISQQDAADCGADPVTDTYMNDRRFVGIRNFGPIPEGTYRLAPSGIQRFTLGEELGLIAGGIVHQESAEAGGTRLHPGDWGSGRVALNPVGRLREGPCGNANRRSGFFLHGGLLAGSSGCIDIGTNFDTLADFLDGYRRPITLTVEYSQPAPSVGYFTGLSGAVGYWGFDLRLRPSAALGFETGAAGTRLVPSVGADAIAAWAGGNLQLGLRLDLPLNDREAFVRAALTGGTNFRILGALYGRLFGGASLTLGGPQSGAVSPMLGGGLGYDFGRVQLEVLYDVLNVASQDQRVHQALVGVGFTFGQW